MRALTRWLNAMDRRAFLGLDVWEFGILSLRHPYGRLFLGRVVLRHPAKVWTGWRTYRRSVRPARHPHLAPVGIKSEDDFCQKASSGPWLLATGFCEKPLDPPCPAGRFNHDCLWLRHGQPKPPPVACRVCHIRELAEWALPAGAALHIMTSALDIAHDLFLPGLRGTPWKGLLLAVCPFSVAPITLAMTLCQLRGLVIPYESGDCRDYAAWLNADIGIKPEQTRLAGVTHQRLVALLERAARARQSGHLPAAAHYRAQDPFFVPVAGPVD